MNTYVNYVVEANFGLLIMLLFHQLLLRSETQFSFKRTYLLVGIFASLLFPVIKIQTVSSSIPSIRVMSTYILPELAIGGEVTQSTPISLFNYWIAIQWIYLAVAALLLGGLVLKLITIFRHLRTSTASTLDGRYRVIEIKTDAPSFSFFHYIFVGNISAFSSEEKEQIIKHEITHATNFHSMDILLVEVLKILFWFNPVVYYLKSLLTSIHEFQADQLAVENRDVNQYCNLLARVALQSADYPIANHFNNSLTLKRIAMMKTAKTKLSRWKVAAIVPLLTGLFVFVACQDQVITDIKDITSKSTMVDEGNYTVNVKTMVDKLQAENPSKSYFVMELTDDPSEGKLDKKIAELESEYKANYKAATGTWGVKGEENRSFIIFERGERTQQLSNLTKTEGEVFTIVETPATPPNGIPEFYKMIGQNLVYPLEARQQGIEGKVFVEFIINTDGTLSDIKTMKHLNEFCDREAERVVALSPPWSPGKQRGIAVRQRMVLPITFMLEGSHNKVEESKTESTMTEMVVSGHPAKKN